MFYKLEDRAYSVLIYESSVTWNILKTVGNVIVAYKYLYFCN